ncbi:MaoC family dehydratase [Granulicoccus sp. GXG6511]|uniref:MaoC family dehydratase n=1 Tax=Granulicoccus sp. GXG6511 TaxID=3381351 RepID=UPI003D7E96C7
MTNLPEPVNLAAPPTVLREFVRGMLRTPLRARPGKDLPDTVLRLPRARIERQHLFAYQKLTGFTANELLPPTYPHLLGFPLQARLLAGPDFPLPLAGLVHIANEITQRDPLFADDQPDVTVRAENLRPHPKGTAVDLITELHVLGAVAWSSRSTYLHRGRENPGSETGPAAPEAPTSFPSARWRLPADLGRRYAAISGDVNPIHLHPLAARAFGFPRAIAHGMWSLARTLAAFGQDAQGPHTNRVWFRKPILLPTTIAFAREPGAPVAAVVNAKDRERVHLVVDVHGKN